MHHKANASAATAPKSTPVPAVARGAELPLEDDDGAAEVDDEVPVTIVGVLIEMPVVELVEPAVELGLPLEPGRDVERLAEGMLVWIVKLLLSLVKDEIGLRVGIELCWMRVSIVVQNETWKRRQR
jgi:hypothetical protein